MSMTESQQAERSRKRAEVRRLRVEIAAIGRQRIVKFDEMRALNLRVVELTRRIADINGDTRGMNT
jgi:hypothetical protein